MTKRTKAWLRGLVFAVVGVAAVAVLVKLVHAGTLLTEVHRALYVMPFVLVLEAGQLAFEMGAVWCLYGEERRKISVRNIMRAALLGYPVMVLMPAGRTVAEAVRATYLKRFTNGPVATAVAIEMQSVLLVAIGAVSAVCAVCIVVIGGTRPLILAVVGNAVVTVAIGFAIIAVRRRTSIGAWLAQRFERFRAAPEVDAVLRARPRVPLAAVALAVLGRLCQVGEIAVLFYAIADHVTVARAFAVEGVNLVGTSLGDLFPGGIGATDAAFTYAGPHLGITPGGGLAIALLLHATQATWCVLSVLAAGVGRFSPRGS